MNIETKIIEQAKKHGWTIIFGEPSVSDYLLGVWNPNGDLKYYNRVHHKDPIPKEVIDILLKECTLKDNMNNNDKIKLDGSYAPPSSVLPPPCPSQHRKLYKQQTMKSSSESPSENFKELLDNCCIISEIENLQQYEDKVKNDPVSKKEFNQVVKIQDQQIDNLKFIVNNICEVIKQLHPNVDLSTRLVGYDVRNSKHNNKL